MFDFRDGDVLVTNGKGGFWPLRRLVLWIVYRGIRAYQKAKWGAASDYRPTHVRVWLGGGFFEMTVPNGCWTPLADIALNSKDWKVARYRGQTPLDPAAMAAVAQEMVGKPYDKGDLLDFALSGLAGLFARTFRILGDRANKYRVCSTAAAKVLVAGGAQIRVVRADLQPDAEIAHNFSGDTTILPDDAVDPAYFINNPSTWEVVGDNT